MLQPSKMLQKMPGSKRRGLLSTPAPIPAQLDSRDPTSVRLENNLGTQANYINNPSNPGNLVQADGSVASVIIVSSRVGQITILQYGPPRPAVV